MSEIKKPVITKEQAEALEIMRRIGGPDNYILMAACDGIIGGELADIDIMTLAAALINGYEVEKTPEEKVREWFEEEREIGDEYYNRGEEHRSQDVVQTIIDTLDILGIKIEGVNA
ncbi:hypothetical protein [Bacillus sp. NSP9.1]|uniref:hypothetical protein n=1 Tax=Bacillus sp. NSP9.1 TaxID=1071078 RepID=UPI0004116984|nr:hypothetical protein [Bacillus sp. NSP9.1]QHZ45847.1 hypothetical protein M654_005710 [Bacillus sp. NSP9.1]